MYLLDVFIVLTTLAALGSLAIAVLAAQRPGIPGARFLALNFVGAAIWCGAYVGELQSLSLDAKTFWARVAYLGIVIVPPSWFLFVVSYLGVLRPRIAPLFFILPLATVAFVALAPGIPWVWQDVSLAEGGGITTLAVVHGPWFWAHTVYSYLLLGAGSVLLVAGIFRRARALTAQGLLIAAAVVLPWITNVLTVFGIFSLDNLDLTPPALVVSAALVVLGLLRLQVLEVFPAMVSIAHDTVLREMQDGVVVIDERCRVLNANASAARLIGAEAGLVGDKLPNWLVVDGPKELDCAALTAAAAKGEPVRAHATKRPEVALEGVVSRLGRRGRWRGYVLVLRDVTEREATTRALADSEERLRVVFDQSPVAAMVFDTRLRITECNGLLREMLGSASGDLRGGTLSSANASTLLALCQGALRGETSRYDGPFVVEPDEELWLQCRVSPLFSGDEITGGMCVAWDVTGAKRAEALIERLAFHDTLTGLPNRSLYRDRLRQAVDEAERKGLMVAIGHLDIDRFKTVNEAMGQTVADELLQRLAKRLEGAMRAGDTLARVAGDELAFIMPNVHDMAEGLRMGEKVLSCVREPWTIASHTFAVTGSLGLAVYPNDAGDAYGLLENAERALRRARDAGGDRHCFYDLSMNLEATERLDVEQGLRTALSEDQLVVYYEPQVSLEDGRIRGVEALVRWNHPTRGLLPPACFIGIAEESGLIGRLGEWVLRRACRDIAAGPCSDLRVAVNLSPKDLQNSDLPAIVAAILRDTGLEPGRLEIELTETAVITDLEGSCRALEELRALGVGIVLDDFGTGYASLSHLHRLPIDKVKVDRSFVMRCEDDQDAACIVSALVGLAHNLSLGVVAEGIETAHQAVFLRELGCDEGQGHLYAVPEPPESCPAFRCVQGSLQALV